MKVLAVGATGVTAGMVVPELVKRGVEVRGLVRDAAKADVARRNGATETAIADLNDVEALTRAADGVDGVFGIIPAFAEDEAGIGTNLVHAAVRAGVANASSSLPPCCPWRRTSTPPSSPVPVTSSPRNNPTNSSRSCATS